MPVEVESLHRIALFPKDNTLRFDFPAPSFLLKLDWPSDGHPKIPASRIPPSTLGFFALVEPGQRESPTSCKVFRAKGNSFLICSSITTMISSFYIYIDFPQQFLYFFPEPQGQASFRPTLGISL